MKYFLEYEEFQDITGSRSATKEAFNKGLLESGQEWMDMINSRNKTVHTYHSNILETEFHKITQVYVALFHNFHTKMKSLL